MSPKLSNLTKQCHKNSQCSKMPKKALIFLPQGAEEMEFVIAVDVLRRAGVDVKVAGLPDKNLIKCSRGIVINPDIGIQEAQKLGPFDVMILPGGLGGVRKLAESEEVGKLLKQQDSEGRMVAAICAAPTALRAHSIGLGKKITSNPFVQVSLSEGGEYEYKDDKVVADGNLITSRGPGTAYDFALCLVEKLMGKEKAQEVARSLLVSYQCQ